MVLLPRRSMYQWEIVAGAAMDDWRVADELEAEDFAVELHGRGHVEDLEERAEAVEVDCCGG